MNKNQQMRWNRYTVQLYLTVRIHVLNGTLEGAFRANVPMLPSIDESGGRPLSVRQRFMGSVWLTPPSHYESFCGGLRG
jgi:hypothetical protein